jgi:hypothetical protein
MLRMLTFSVPLEKRELTVKPPLLKPCQNVSQLYTINYAYVHLSASPSLPLLDEGSFVRRLLLSVLKRDALALVCLENRAYIRWFVDADSCRSDVVSSEWTNSQEDLTFEEGDEFNEPFVPRLALPWLQNNGVFWVGCHVFGMRVELYVRRGINLGNGMGKYLGTHNEDTIKRPVKV